MSFSDSPRSATSSRALRMRCRLMPVSRSRLITFSRTMSSKLYSRCEPDPSASRTDGTTNPVEVQWSSCR